MRLKYLTNDNFCSILSSSLPVCNTAFLVRVGGDNRYGRHINTFPGETLLQVLSAPHDGLSKVVLPCNNAIVWSTDLRIVFPLVQLTE